MASAQRTSMLTEAREREMRASSSVSHKQQSVIWWVRRDLRLFDNPALLAAIATGSAVVRKNKTNMEARILSVFLSIYVSVRVCVCVCVCEEASLSLVRGTRSAYFLQVVEIVHNGTCVQDVLLNDDEQEDVRTCTPVRDADWKEKSTDDKT